MIRKYIPIFQVAALLGLIELSQAQDSVNFPTIGEIIKLDDSLEQLIDLEADIEVLSSGFLWSEGPVWVPEKEHPSFFRHSQQSGGALGRRKRG